MNELFSISFSESELQSISERYKKEIERQIEKIKFLEGFLNKLKFENANFEEKHSLEVNNSNKEEIAPVTVSLYRKESNIPYLNDKKVVNSISKSEKIKIDINKSIFEKKDQKDLIKDDKIQKRNEDKIETKITQEIQVEPNIKPNNNDKEIKIKVVKKVNKPKSNLNLDGITIPDEKVNIKDDLQDLIKQELPPQKLELPMEEQNIGVLGLNYQKSVKPERYSSVMNIFNQFNNFMSVDDVVGIYKDKINSVGQNLKILTKAITSLLHEMVFRKRLLSKIYIEEKKTELYGLRSWYSENGILKPDYAEKLNSRLLFPIKNPEILTLKDIF